MLLEQAYILDRPSVIRVEVKAAQASSVALRRTDAYEVRVGGRAVITLRGRMVIPSG